MAIAFATTTISARGHRDLLEDFDPDTVGFGGDPIPEPETLFTGVRASITKPRGRIEGNTPTQRYTSTPGSLEQEADVFAFRADPCDLTRFDLVTDETTGTEYEILWIRKSEFTGFGLDHMLGELKQVVGVAA